jgi:FkbM family methyltransferase
MFNKLKIIISKKVYNSNLILFYNIFDHLNFLFKKEIKYEFDIINNIEKYLSNSKLIFDIGSNIGQYALNLSRITNFNSRIYCFEPDISAYSYLNFNLNMNKLSNVTSFNFGIGEFNTQLDYFIDSKTGSRKGSFIKDFVGNNYKGHKSTIETKNLFYLFTLYGSPDFIKIDVEGFEIEIIKGLNNYNIKNIKFLIETRISTIQFIYNYFHQLDFNCILVDNKEPVKILNIKDIPDFANLLFYHD